MSLSRAQLQALAEKQLSQPTGIMSDVDTFASNYFPEVRQHALWAGDLKQCIMVLLQDVDPDRLEEALNKWHPISVAVYGDRELVQLFIAALRVPFPELNVHDGPGDDPDRIDIEVHLESGSVEDTLVFTGNGLNRQEITEPHTDHARGILDLATRNFPEVLAFARRRWDTK